MSKSLVAKPKPDYTRQVEFATRHDIDLVREELKHDIDLVRKDIDLVRKDIDLVRKDVDIAKLELKHDMDFLKQEVKQDMVLLKQDIKWLRWVTVIAGSILLAGMGALLTLMIYLHSDTQTDMKELNKKLDFVIQKIK